MNNIKKIISAYMAIEGLSQLDMATMLGISRQSFNYKLNGRVAFSDKEKITIAELFNSDVSSIFFNNKVATMATKIVSQQ